MADLPTIEITAEMWAEVMSRNDRYRRRSRVSMVASIISGTISAVLIVGLIVGFLAFRDVPAQQRQQTEILNTVREVVNQQQASIAALAAADTQRQCQSKSTALAFAVVLDLLADAFDTPPAPDPDRQKAVAGFRSTADAFKRAASGQAPQAACPPTLGGG